MSSLLNTQIIYVCVGRVFSTSSRYRQNDRNFIQNMSENVLNAFLVQIRLKCISLVSQRPVMMPKSILDRLYRFCLRSRPKPVRDIPNLNEILYETCSKNEKFVRVYLKRLFNILIFGKKINLSIDSGYVNK